MQYLKSSYGEVRDIFAKNRLKRFSLDSSFNLLNG